MDTSVLRAGLDVLDDRYAAVLGGALPDDAAVASARARFRRDGHVRVPGVVPAPALEALLRELWPILYPVAYPVRLEHRPDADGELTCGARFRRVDPGAPGSPTPGAHGAGTARVLDAVGFTGFGHLLAGRIAPLLDRIVGHHRYERMFANLYVEDDYISAHDDGHVGDRVDVMFPVTLEGVGGLRVLDDGLLTPVPDGQGAMFVLGPRVWHEVPPLRRDQGRDQGRGPGSGPDRGRDPRRMTLTLRYP